MNLDQLRRDLTTKQDAARTKFAAVCQTAEKESRALNDDEKRDVQALVDDASAMKARIDKAESDVAIGRAIDALVPAQQTAALVPARPIAGVLQPRVLVSMGEQFVRSDSFKFFAAGGHRTASAWRSPSIEVFDPRGQYAATLTEDPASGGKLVMPDYQAGVQQINFRRLVVADLIAPGTTDSNLISYMVEKSFVNASDTVAEGAAKPESTLTFDATSDPVRKIAHWLPVSEEMLEDVAQIRSYIDARLTLGVQLTEEDQLLNGSLVAPDIIGIRNRVGLRADVAVTAPATGADAIFAQMMAIYGSSFLMPDGIVMNPANWQAIQLMKDSSGAYVGSGPFAAPQAALLWGLPVAVTPAIEAGTALVGAFRSGAQVFRKGGIRIEASNSHQDFFVKNLVAIRAEERLALAVYRPGAFGEVTGLA